MAQINVLKIGSSGFPQEMDTTADDLTANSFTVNGGLVLSSSGIDLQNGNLSDVNDISFTDPTADGITVTAGTFAADNILLNTKENSLTSATTALLFSTITDNADQVDAFRLPALAGAPSATPTDGGEGYLVWDSTNNNLYAWDGAAWANQSSGGITSYTADENLLIRDAVYISAADNVSKADASAESTARVVGFATAAATDTNSVNIQSSGILSGFSTLTSGAPQFLSETAGEITETPPTTSGAQIVLVGYAKNTTDIDIQFQKLGIRA